MRVSLHSHRLVVAQAAQEALETKQDDARLERLKKEEEAEAQKFLASQFSAEQEAAELEAAKKAAEEAENRRKEAEEALAPVRAQILAAMKQTAAERDELSKEAQLLSARAQKVFHFCPRMLKWLLDFHVFVHDVCAPLCVSESLSV